MKAYSLETLIADQEFKISESNQTIKEYFEDLDYERTFKRRD